MSREKTGTRHSTEANGRGYRRPTPVGSGRDDESFSRSLPHVLARLRRVFTPLMGSRARWNGRRIPPCHHTQVGSGYHWPSWPRCSVRAARGYGLFAIPRTAQNSVRIRSSPAWDTTAVTPRPPWLRPQTVFPESLHDFRRSVRLRRPHATRNAVSRMEAPAVASGSRFNPPKLSRRWESPTVTRLESRIDRRLRRKEDLISSGSPGLSPNPREPPRRGVKGHPCNPFSRRAVAAWTVSSLTA